MPATASRPEPADQMPADALPVDVATIRATVDRALTDGPLPKYEDLENLEALLRGHIQLLLPDAEEAMAKRWRGSVEWHGKRADLNLARDHLKQGLGAGLISARRHVTQLAHDCRTLLRYAEAGQ